MINLLLITFIKSYFPILERPQNTKTVSLLWHIFSRFILTWYVMVCGATIISTCAFTTHILNVLDDVVLLLLYTNVSHVRFRTKHDIRYTSPSLWMFINLLDSEKMKSKIEKTTCHVDILCTQIILLRHYTIYKYQMYNALHWSL